MRRGRPPKYGRPAQVITMTLPEDVVDWLKRMHPDPAWAVVKLFERSQRLGRGAARPRPPADLVQLPRNRSLILVQPELLTRVAGVAVIPLADGRGFLALDDGKGLADLELALLDRIEAPDAGASEREGLIAVRETIRRWRLQGLRFEARSILVAERRRSGEPTEVLPELAAVE